jgi:hypothetical protein
MEQNDIDRNRLKLLKLVKESLDQYDIQYWLDCGTLLGAVRDKKIISYDHDIDFGTWQENSFIIYKAVRGLSNEGIEILIAPNGFTLKNEYFSLSIILYMKTGGYSKIHWGTSSIQTKSMRLILDLLIWSTLLSHFSMIGYDIVPNRGGRIMLHLSGLGHYIPNRIKKYIQKLQFLYGEKYVWIIPTKYFQKLKIIRFYDMDFSAPLNTEEYLTFRYGDDWMIEKSNWVTSRDDGAVYNARSFQKNNL